MGVQTTFETDPQLAEARQPRMRSLHHPAMPSQSLAAFHSPPGDSCGNAALTQMPATSLEVVPLVGVQLVRSAAWTPLQASNRRQCIDQWLEHHRIMSVRTRHHQRQRHPATVNDQMPLATRFAAVGWVRARFLAPRGLATLAPSILARLQSIWSYCRRRPSNVWCSRSQTPDCCHACRRRQQLMPLP